MRKLSGELIVIIVGFVCLIGVATTLYLARETSKYTIRTEFGTYCVENFRTYGKGISFTTKSGDVIVSQGNFEIILNKKQ
jgi:uncharacterized protein involved in exopolysaccharide biosynthesis